MVRHGTLASVCALLLWIGGCPKRQESKSTVVYVPAHPPAAEAPAAKEEVVVIEEPAPPAPETEETPPAPTPGPTPRRSPRRPVRAETTPEPDQSPAPENPETPPAEFPALAPRESSAQETELRRQYLQLDQDIRQRLARLSGAPLSTNDRNTLEVARTFFAQATHAMANGDLPRALNLARKASLLLAALE